MTARIIRRHLIAAAAGAALAATAAGAHAAMIVYDPTSYAKMIEQAKTALGQLEQLKTQVSQGQELLGSLNDASGLDALARELDQPALRNLLPDVASLTRGADGFEALGEIGRRAGAIRQSERLYTPAPQDARGRDLEDAGGRAARDLALGEAVMSAGAERLKGLQTLEGAIGGASTARGVLDLQARLAAEQAMIANDQVRLQGLAMAQDAEDRLQAQRERERAAAARQSRIDLYRQGF
jgi:type IV secretion system protein VirB5